VLTLELQDIGDPSVLAVAQLARQVGELSGSLEAIDAREPVALDPEHLEPHVLVQILDVSDVLLQQCRNSLVLTLGVTFGSRKNS
jgi:hypothetical protein